MWLSPFKLLKYGFLAFFGLLGVMIFRGVLKTAYAVLVFIGLGLLQIGLVFGVGFLIIMLDYFGVINI